MDQIQFAKKLVRLSANEGTMYFLARYEACVASVSNVSVGFGSKERPTNGIFGVFPARKMGREPKKRKGRWGRGRKITSIAAHAEGGRSLTKKNQKE